MKVLVWKGYGSIDVFAANRLEDVDYIISNLDIVIALEGIDYLDKFCILINKVKSSSDWRDIEDSRKVRRLLGNIVTFVNTQLKSSPSFEYFEIQGVHEVK